MSIFLPQTSSSLHPFPSYKAASTCLGIYYTSSPLLIPKSVLAWAAITKYQRVGSLNRNSFSQSSRDDRSNIKRCPQGWFLLRAFLLAYRSRPAHCVFTWLGEEGREEEQIASFRLFLSGHQSHHEEPTLWPHLNLIISKRPHLQIGSLAVLSFNMNWGGGHNSVQSTAAQKAWAAARTWFPQEVGKGGQKRRNSRRFFELV